MISFETFENHSSGLIKTDTKASGIKKGHEPKAALFTDSNLDDDYFMLMAVPPLTSTEKIDIPKEVIFVVDVSGSMQGTSIAQAKNSLHYSISRLDSDDSFNIIASPVEKYTIVFLV